MIWVIMALVMKIAYWGGTLSGKRKAAKLLAKEKAEKCNKEKKCSKKKCETPSGCT